VVELIHLLKFPQDISATPVRTVILVWARQAGNFFLGAICKAATNFEKDHATLVCFRCSFLMLVDITP
jgi:hypothetical protein